MKAILVLIILLISNGIQAGIDTIIVRNTEYVPSSLTINPTDTVRFIWEEGIHPTASYSDSWITFTMSSSMQQYDLVLDEPGNHNYYCEFYEALGMVATIEVRSPQLLPGNTVEDEAKIFYNSADKYLVVTFPSYHLFNVEIYNLLGKKVWKSQDIFANETIFKLNNRKGIFVILIEGRNDEILASEKIIMF